MFEGGEAGDLVFRCQGGVVGDVVDGAGKIIVGRHVRAQRGGQQPGADRKVLVGRALARRGFDPG
jgi:hypothetical protein